MSDETPVCDHPHVTWISMDVMPPIVYGYCNDCDKRFREREEVPDAAT